VTERVGKLDVARRQIVEAIRLFFERRDPIAIHTLAAAAHQVLVDLAHRNGKARSILKGAKGSVLAEDAEYLRSINFPFNYFKHADRDPDAFVNIGSLGRLSQDLILDCALLLQQLAKRIPAEVKIFWAWYVALHREEFDDLPRDGAIGKLQALNLDQMPFDEISRFIVFSNIVDSMEEES
jgi:hypothetical protein